ncbi:hypothetical protein Daus18300_001763 [Diaporthe australafricana]|uniref:YDG domain-containing protein n=1 Tax=Diaporthe australafricana TaxID=127596 RepID=A0ABR3XUC8_9PEZI
MPRKTANAVARVRHPDDTRMPEDVLVPPTDHRLSLRWIKIRSFELKQLVKKYETSRGAPISRDARQLLDNARNRIFPYLLFDIRMTPDVKRISKIDEPLLDIARAPMRFPRDLVASAELLYQKFESESWGAVTKTPKPSLTGSEPPVDHPIWGLDGIMHGARMVDTGKKVDYELDRRYVDEQRDAKVYGDNGLTPGDWFPLKIIARFRGAHADTIRGISGDRGRGAYCIVVSGQYDEDLDEGDMLYYSGEAADKNEDPHHVIERATNASLVQSWTLGGPMRVLRSASKGERGRHYSPQCGIRYDGLYNVIGVEERHNVKGGLYQRFKLRRRSGQESLDDIAARSPTLDQRRDYRNLRQGY